MLYLDAPIGPINGLMIYQDHQDPDLFYYVPERPRLARNDGVPEFVFLKYRRDITDNPDFDEETKQSLGGGFLAFTVDLGVDDDLLEDTKGKLSAFAEGQVKLTPVQFRKGSVRLSISKDAADADDAPDDEPKGVNFFEEVMGASKPSLFGFNRATFGVMLSQEGAVLMEAALRSGISPVGVIYDLEFLALRPAFNVVITAEYKRIYNHLEVEFGARGQVGPVSLAADIGAAFQKLRDEGAIRVEVQNFTDDEDLRKKADEAFDFFKTQLLKDFFKSSLQPPSFMTRQAGQGLLGQLQGLFGSLTSGTSRSNFQPQRGNPTSQQATPAQPSEDLSSSERSTSQTNNTASAASGGGGGTGGGSGADSSVAPFQVAFSLRFYRQEELKKRTFEYSMQAAVARDAAPQGLFSTIVDGLDLDRAIVEVSLDDDFFNRVVSDVTMGGDLEASGISTVAVNLDYPGERAEGVQPSHVDGFIFRPTQLEGGTFTTFVNEQQDRSYRFQLDLHFRPDTEFVGKDAHVVTDWEVTQDRQLTLDPLDYVGVHLIEISLGDVDSGQLSQVQAELRYEDQANNFTTEKTFLLRPGDAPQMWKLRLSDDEQREYSYRLTYFLNSGIRVEEDWQTSESPTLVVNEPFQGNLEVRLVPLLEASNLIEAIVDLTYEEEDTGYTRRVQQVFNPLNLQSAVINIPTLAENPQRYTREVTIVRMDGSVFASDPIESENRVAVISDGEGATRRVTVRLVGTSLAQAGLTAMKVDLTGPGDDPDRDSAIFTPTQSQDQTLSLVAAEASGSFPYSFQVTGYDLQGHPVEGDSGDSSDDTLLVNAPGQ
ncbi:MAG TPA: hypothetical protein VLV83_11470 [Acidobacteriota bacterium]|nr:hypothetical protein [Acidobacteriota bacterium]